MSCVFKIVLDTLTGGRKRAAERKSRNVKMWPVRGSSVCDRSVFVQAVAIELEIWVESQKCGEERPVK